MNTDLARPVRQPLPFTPGELDAYWLKIKRSTHPSILGGHMTRRKGQSLEFREFAPYTPGDDMRHVDWRASARYRGPDDLLVRRFQAEEQFIVIISIDGRATLWLPDALPKLCVAFWLAEALAWISLGTNDRLFLHDLFGQGSSGLQLLRGKGDRSRLSAVLARLWEGMDAGREDLNLRVLDRIMRPAVVWIIITDLYFAESGTSSFLGATAHELARAIARARDGLRWVILIDLDTWAYERTALGEGGLYIDGPGQRAQERPYEITHDTLEGVEASILLYKEEFQQLSRIPAGDFSHWSWPRQIGTPAAGAAFFCHQFQQDKTLSSIYERSP
jgi:hypothetical protein